MVAQRDGELRKALNSSWLTVADGKPVVWAARLLGGKIKNTVRGTDFTIRISAMAEREGFSVFLYGAKETTLRRMKDSLLKSFPRLRIIGTFSPPFRDLHQDETAGIINMINSASPDILLIGLGAPKQEKWMANYCPSIVDSVTLGVGAAFDFISGEKRQAPLWMQVRGLEWLFRLLEEPGRLWARYIVYNPLYISLILWQLLRERLSKGRVSCIGNRQRSMK